MHPTVTPEEESTESHPPVIVLTGRPGVGKTTIADLCSSIGAGVYTVSDEPVTKETLSDGIMSASGGEPEVVVVDGISDTLTLNRVTEICSDVLIVRVAVSDAGERKQRFMEKRLNELSDGNQIVSTDMVMEIQNEYKRSDSGLLDRHHLTLMNDEDTETTELIVRLDEICSLLAP